MAVAIENSLVYEYSSSGATSYTRSFTISGSNRYLTVSVLDVAGDTVTGVTYGTYGGVAMTQLGKTSVGTRYVYMYGLANPTTGTNDIVATRSSSTSVFGFGAINISGATQTTSPVDASATASVNSTTPSISLTSVTDNSAVIVTASTMNNPIAASTNLTGVVGDASFVISAMSRSATFPKTPAGSQTYTFTTPSGDTGLVAVSIAPFAAATSHIKSADGILIANIKSADGVTQANIKSWNGITN